MDILCTSKVKEYEGSTLFAKLVYLCDEFEHIGSSSWEIEECLSIRCRYFFYDKARVYRCESYPGLVYDCDAAVRALNLAEEILSIVAGVSEETLTGRASARNGVYKYLKIIIFHKDITAISLIIQRI